MDAFDFFVPSGPEPPRGRSLSHNIAAGVVVLGLPLVDMFIVLIANLSKRPETAVFWLPLGFGLLGALICRVVRMSLGQSVVSVLVCLGWCAFASVCLVMMDIFIMPF
jgi:hypothetical protein